MGHGGIILGAEHGGLVLENGITFGVLAALTAVRSPARSLSLRPRRRRSESASHHAHLRRPRPAGAGVLGDMLRAAHERHDILVEPVHQQPEVHVLRKGHQVQSCRGPRRHRAHLGGGEAGRRSHHHLYPSWRIDLERDVQSRYAPSRALAAVFRAARTCGSPMGSHFGSFLGCRRLVISGEKKAPVPVRAALRPNHRGTRTATATAAATVATAVAATGGRALASSCRRTLPLSHLS